MPRQNSTRNNLTVDFGGDAAIIYLGGLPALAWDLNIGVGYTRNKISVRCFVDNYYATYGALMANRTYREAITMPCASIEYRVTKIYPFIFAGAGIGNFEVQNYGEHLWTRKTVWGLGGGLKYNVITLGARYLGPSVDIASVDTSGYSPITTRYPMNGDFQLFLGLSFKINLYGKLVF